jgi:hypothetical protein
MYGVQIIWGIGGGVLPLPLGLYNELHVTSRCWLESPPTATIEHDCTTQAALAGAFECGGDAPVIDPNTLRHLLTGLPGALSLVTIVGCNFMVYLTVRNSERRMARYSMSTNTRQRKRTLETASQARWYVCVFFNSIVWLCLIDLLSMYGVITPQNESSWTALILLSQFFSASAGFGFLLTYIRPRYLRHRTNGNSRIEALAKGLKIRKAEIALSAEERLSVRTLRTRRESGQDEDSTYVRTFNSSSLLRFRSSTVGNPDVTAERPVYMRRNLPSLQQEGARSAAAVPAVGTTAAPVKEETAASSMHDSCDPSAFFTSTDFTFEERDVPQDTPISATTADSSNDGEA